MKPLIISLVLIILNIATMGQQLKKDEPVRFLALGDSYTIGQGVSETERWPNQLADVLKEIGYEVEEVKIIARTGWRTDDLQSALDAENPDSLYNLVSLLIGVNNQYQGVNFDLYYAEFSELLNRAIALCGGKKSGVFVLSIPDYGYTPFGSSDKETISAEIDQYNETNRRIAFERGVKYIDITPISREAEEKPEYLASDNLHPSGLMYARWVDEVVSYMNFDTSTGINIPQKEKNGILYPNPATNRLIWDSEKPIASIRLYNALGVPVMHKNVQGLQQLDLDLSTVNSGVYSYKITMVDKSIISGKLVVQ